MRNATMLVVLVAILVAGLVVPASAGGGGLLAGLSWPLYSERDVEVRAGLSQHLKLSDASNGSVKAVPAIEPAIIPMDRRDAAAGEGVGFFNDIRFLRIDLLAMGVDPGRIKRTDMGLWRDDAGVSFDGGYTLVIDLHAQTPGEKVLVAEVTHNASRREGEITIIPIIFVVKTVKHVLATDYVVSRFILVDVGKWVIWATPRMFGKGVCPKDLDEDQRNLARAAVLEDQGRDSLQFMYPLPRYNFMSQLEHMRLQGAPAPFQQLEDTPYRQAMAEVAALKVQLESDIQSLRDAEAKRIADIEAARIVAEAEVVRITAEAEATRKAAEQAANWPDDLREIYNDAKGYVFVAVGSDGLPCGNSLTLTFFQKLTTCQWKENTNNPMVSQNGIIEFTYSDPEKFVEWGWIGFGVSTNGAEPATMYRLNNELNMIAVSVTANGGASYEAK